MPSPARTSPLPRSKRLLFALVIAVALYAFVELFSFVAYRFITGESFSFTVLHEQQQTRIDSEPEQGPNDEYRATLAPHPYVGFVFDPTKQDEGGASPPTSHGLLNETGPVQRRAPDRLIVGVTGGSVAMEVASLGGDALRAALTEHPAFAGREIVLVRLAVNAYKQPQQLLLLNYLLALGAEFDVLVNVDGFNEATITHTNVAEGVFPAFPRMWTALASQMPDPRARRMIGRIEHLEATRRELAGACAGVPLPSVTVGLLWKTADNALRTAAQDARLQLSAVTPGDRPFAVTGPQVMFGEESEVVDEIVDTWRRCSLQMHRICEDHGIRYFHFLQPNQYVVGSKELTAAERRTAYVEEQSLVREVRLGYPHLQVAGGTLRDEGVAFADLTMMFEHVTETLYRDTCCHLNQRGNDLLARAIAREIVFVADAVVAAGAGRSEVAIERLRAARTEILLTRPSEIVDLGLSAEWVDGSARPVVRGAELRSSAPEIVRVLRRGAIEAIGPGRATVTAEYGGHSVDVTVTVHYPPVAHFGRGSVGPDGLVPQLRAKVNGDVIEFDLSRVPAGTTGQILASTRLDRTLWCGGELYVPLDSPAAIPFTTAARPDNAGGASVEIPLRAGVDSTITYWQAMVRSPTTSCGWIFSNGVAITVE